MSHTFEFKHALTFTPDADTAITKTHTVTITEEVLVSLSVQVADSTTDDEHALAIDVSELSAFFAVSSQNVTIETNDGDAPDDTITLTANVPWIWHTSMPDAVTPYTCPLGTDVTAVFITNAGGTAADVEIYAALTSA